MRASFFMSARSGQPIVRALFLAQPAEAHMQLGGEGTCRQFFVKGQGAATESHLPESSTLALDQLYANLGHRRSSVLGGSLVAGLEQRQDHATGQQAQGYAKREQGGNLDEIVQENLAADIHQHQR